VEILSKLLAFDTLGFHARRWADAFLACCEEFLPAAACAPDAVTWRGRRVPIVVAPAQVDVPGLRDRLAGAPAQRWRQRLAPVVHGHRVIVRVDRVDLWKNVVRGFLAFERLAAAGGHDDVVFLALLAKSRMHLPGYRRYLAACVRAARGVDERLRAAGRGRLHLSVAGHSDHSRALAVLSLADAVLVNSTSDGLNLVAKESVVASDGRSRPVLSETTGVYEEIGRWAHRLNPFDIDETATALASALAAGAGRPELRDAVHRNAPPEWLRRRLAAVTAAPPPT
jgi:trehalose 6-phosphate synthase